MSGEHLSECRWQKTTAAECEYRETHHYCPHPEHACDCPPAAFLDTDEYASRPAAPPLYSAAAAPPEVPQPDEPPSVYEHLKAQKDRMLAGHEDIADRVATNKPLIWRDSDFQLLLSRAREHSSDAVRLRSELARLREGLRLARELAAEVEMWAKSPGGELTQSDALLLAALSSYRRAQEGKK